MRHGYVVAVDIRGELSYCVQTHVALQRTRYPRTDAAFASECNPFARSVHSAVQRRFQDDVLRTDSVEQLLLHGPVVYADKLLVERDRYRRSLAQRRHLRPLVLANRLLDRVDVVLRKLFETLQRTVGSESAVGVYAQLNLFFRESAAYMAHKVEFAVEVDGANLQFDASEAGTHLLLQALQHLLVVAHPHQSVDRYACLATSETVVEQHTCAATLEVEQSRLKSEQNRRIRTQSVVADVALLLYDAAKLMKTLLIFGRSVAAQVGQRRTFAHALHTGTCVVGSRDEPRLARGVNAARRSGRLFEVECAWGDA